MASPIRWDNVNGPSLAEASRPLELARASFGDAFAGLKGVVQDSETINASNWQNQKANNTSTYLDAVAGLKNIDEAKAAQSQGGALDQLRKSFGFQIDANAIRGATDQRMAALQQQAKAGIEFEGIMRNERTAPLVDNLRTALMSGDKQAEAAARTGLATAGYRDFAAQTQFADQWNRMKVEREQQDSMFGLKTRQGEQDIAASKANVVNQQGMLGVARQNAATQSASVNNQIKMTDFNIDTATSDRINAKAAGQAQALKNSLREDGNIYADGVFNGSQTGELMEFMVKNKIGDNQEDRANIIKKMTDLSRKGVDIKAPNGQTMNLKDLPMSYVRAAIMGSKDPFWNVGWNDGYASDAGSTLTKMLETTSVNNGKASSKAIDDLVAFKQSLQGVQNNPVPVYPQKAKPPGTSYKGK